jgi:hypothetical protein
MADEDPDQYTQQKAERRFQALLRSAVNTPPKPRA